MKQLEKLMLTIGLLDKVTKPMRGIQRTIQQVTSQSRKAFESTAAGVTALIGAAGTFMATVNPANDLNSALREVSSLDVADDTLKKLNEAGLQYSIEFGDSAANYVRSAYDIQSAIAGLTGDDLPRFTTAAGTLAKATKASVGDITSYVGTMYGIFQKQADQMGKGEWVEQLAGKTAAAVQMFKTTGPEMASAFESLGAGAQTMGVSLQEQMAVLGSLQATMSGSEAGTKYGAFLEGLAGAQSDLGLNFNDSSGNLLPVVDILQMIQGQMKGMNALEAQEFLSGAFDGEAVGFIQLMSQNIGKLNGDIAKLGEQTGMQKATEMANKMKDPWAQIASGIQAVFIAVTQKALPAIEPFIAYLVSVTSMMVAWTNEYPELTKWIALAGAALIGLVAIGGTLSLAIGLARYSMVGMMVVTNLWQARTVAVTAAIWLKTAALWAMRTAMLAFVLYGPAVAAFFGVLKASILTSLPAIWAFTAALLANPLTWIVVGIVALVAAISGLIIYWDEVTAAISKSWNWLKGLFADSEWMKLVFAPIYLGIQAVDAAISAFQKIPEWWQSFKTWFASISFAPVWNLGAELIDGLMQKWNDLQVWFSSITLMPKWDLSLDAFESIKQWWVNFKSWLGQLNPLSMLGDSADWLQSKLSWVPGIDAPEAKTTETVKEQSGALGGLALPGSEPTQTEKEGGLFQSISNLWNGGSKTTQVEKIEVHNHSAGVRGEDLMHELEMAAG
ncbi:phage tail tape measure protein [Marinomonas atlantica]|uniref:phage tail tape measure protein n=1 Tax=Marinomonas atlantica TaxID=1806668 RepID=UPI000835256B|nr:phage tail tape measure protein [Marinomonas atlantica]